MFSPLWSKCAVGKLVYGTIQEFAKKHVLIRSFSNILSQMHSELSPVAH